MKGLPVDARGYPIPHFVAWVDGKPDFRLLDDAKFARSLSEKTCTVCGIPLGRFKSFVGGPMNVLQRICGEPPMHRDCALFAVQACPFLLLPLARRRLANLPDDLQRVPGEEMFEEGNPGVTSIWTCTEFRAGRHVRIFELGQATSLEWFTEGRPATTEEIAAACELAKGRLSGRGVSL
jgi:hypothetical protein